MKCLSKHGDVCFTRFDQNDIKQKIKCYHSPSMGKFVYFAPKFKFQTHICENSSSNSFDFDSEKKHCTSTYTLMHYFLDIPK